MDYLESQGVNIEKRWFRKPFFYILAAVLVLVGYFSFRLGLAHNAIDVDNGPWWQGIANVLNIDNSGSDNAQDPNPMPEEEKNRLDVLVLGIRGEDTSSIEEEGGLLTDTIFVVSIDKTTKKSAMVSIPRDLYIDMRAEAANGKEIKLKGKINEVYERGLASGGGLALAKQVVSRITGVYIDNAIVFDFNAFREIVDTLGGVNIKLAKPFIEKNQWGYEFLLPAGDNHLNGDQALYYVRSRFSTSDFDRARRQQEITAAIKNKAAAEGYLSNPIKITSLLSDLKGNVRTDFQIWDIKDVISLANTLGSTSIKNFVINTENLVAESRSEKGEYILLPSVGHFGEVKNLFANILIDG